MADTVKLLAKHVQTGRPVAFRGIFGDLPAAIFHGVRDPLGIGEPEVVGAVVIEDRPDHQQYLHHPVAEDLVVPGHVCGSGRVRDGQYLAGELERGAVGVAPGLELVRRHTHACAPFMRRSAFWRSSSTSCSRSLYRRARSWSMSLTASWPAVTAAALRCPSGGMALQSGVGGFAYPKSSQAPPRKWIRLTSSPRSPVYIPL